MAHRVVSSGSLYYYAEDVLGSSRVITTAGGAVCYEADFYPFGGERTPVVNTCPQNYKFTGKERDSETGNEDFGARYFSSSFGRWLSPEWSAIPSPVPYATLTNPQTWDRYAYVQNNPLAFVDPNGMWSTRDHGEIIDNAFSGTLTSTDRDLLKQASAFVDKDQSLAGASKHGMRAPWQLQWEAEVFGTVSIENHLTMAVSKQLEWEHAGNTGWNPGALLEFGEALHTVTDSASPWHGNYSTAWGYGWDPLGSTQHWLGETFLGPVQDVAKALAVMDAQALWRRWQMQLDAERKKREEEERKKRERAAKEKRAP